MVFDGPLYDLFNGHLPSGECGREADHPAGSTRAQDWRWSYLIEVLTCSLDLYPEKCSNVSKVAEDLSGSSKTRATSWGLSGEELRTVLSLLLFAHGQDEDDRADF